MGRINYPHSFVILKMGTKFCKFRMNSSCNCCQDT